MYENRTQNYDPEIHEEVNLLNWEAVSLVLFSLQVVYHKVVY